MLSFLIDVSKGREEGEGVIRGRGVSITEIVAGVFVGGRVYVCVGEAGERRCDSMMGARIGLFGSIEKR